MGPSPFIRLLARSATDMVVSDSCDLLWNSTLYEECKDEISSPYSREYEYSRYWNKFLSRLLFSLFSTRL